MSTQHCADLLGSDTGFFNYELYKQPWTILESHQGLTLTFFLFRI